MKIAVVGAGSWGTTLADLLARRGHDVMIWAREPEVVQSINESHVNQIFLSDAPLAENLSAGSLVADVVAGREVIVSAAPSHAVRDVSSQIASCLANDRPVVVSVSKGLESDTLKPMSEVLGETLPGVPVVALSGPSFAHEVYDRCPTAIVAASDDIVAAEMTQRVFSTEYFRVYTSADPYGVQLGGALKNVNAIAAGILDGLELGHNASAALITRGLAEMTRLGQALGCDPMTFSGLAGMGDLILTATGAQSRNRSLGAELATGRPLDEILAQRRTVAEGVHTARAAVALGEKAGVELPIAAQVCAVLFDGKPPRIAVSDLMERELKPERW
ncbi:MAG: NAD(P)H-dependent glycerol-3-phosphate dehydrogenase [Gemmatimonadales bacterium]